MALQKEIISKNGAITNYHRIFSVQKDVGNVTVTLRGYASSSYRNEEKQFYTLSKTVRDDMDRYSVLSGINSLTDEEALEKENLEEKLELYYTLSQMGSFYLSETVLMLDVGDTESISFQGIYDAIKLTDDYQGATDC